MNSIDSTELNLFKIGLCLMDKGLTTEITAKANNMEFDLITKTNKQIDNEYSLYQTSSWFQIIKKIIIQFQSITLPVISCT